MKIILFALALVLASAVTWACEITVTVDGGTRKDVYKAGDELTVLVQVKHTHRACRLPINETTYEPEGLEIVAATDWKEITAGVWTRKMKLRVKGSASGNLVFGVRRKCTRDNNVGILKLAGLPVK